MPEPPSAIPIIDLAPLLAGGAEGEEEVACSIGRACRDIGFFYVTGHGVPPQTVAEIFAEAAAFFAAPAAAKEALSFIGPSGNRGFIRLGGETLNPGKPPDVKEAFNIGLELPADDPDLLAGKPFRAQNLWPDQPDFRRRMLGYFDRMMTLGRTLHRAFAIDLGLDPGFFEDKLRKPMATLRLLHYPPTGQSQQHQLGAGVHTDYGNVTLLATDAVGGLMVRDRSGQWREAPNVPGAFLCNIGDCLMRWTNDIYISTPHKVVTPPGRDRYSVAFFVDPDPEARVACLDTCVGPERPAKYPPLSAADFFRSKLEPTYAHAQPVR